jgi:hypothetical protein
MLDLRDLNSSYKRATGQHKSIHDSAPGDHNDQAHRDRQRHERLQYDGDNLFLQSASSGSGGKSKGKKPILTDGDDSMRRIEPRCSIPFIQCSCEARSYLTVRFLARRDFDIYIVAVKFRRAERSAFQNGIQTISCCTILAFETMSSYAIEDTSTRQGSSAVTDTSDDWFRILKSILTFESWKRIKHRARQDGRPKAKRQTFWDGYSQRRHKPISNRNLSRST